MRIGTGLATLAVLGAMATSAFAQPGGAGGRGRGGFGGGFGGPQSGLMLAGNPAVQKELGVTEDQIAKLKKLGDEAREEMQAGGGGGDFAALRDLPEEERRAKMTEMMNKRMEATRKVTEKFKPKLAEVLDAKQVERLNQIALQAAGPGAYSDPDVAKALKLSKEQQDKLATITKEFGEKQRASFTGGGGGGGEDARAKMRELSAARDKDLAAVLTADQKTQLDKMKGKEFDVAALRGGPGGPGGGRPGAEGRPKTQAP
ncbi:MAG: Spy/CpxP family protein refolding chaperone [Planctomycetota bacterium]